MNRPSLPDNEQLTLAWQSSGLDMRRFAMVCGVDRRMLQRMRAGKIPVTPKIRAIVAAMLETDSPYA